MEYDVIISLGEWCLTSVALRKYKLQNKSLPFDWSGGILWDKSGYGGLSVKVDLICNNFENFFNYEDFENRGPNPKNEDYWFLWCVNKNTGLQYKHDFPSDQSFENSFVNAREKYFRRVKRLYEQIYSSTNILFIYIARDTGFSDEYLMEQYVKLSRKFPYKNIHMLYIMNDINDSVVEIDLAPNIKKIMLNFGYKNDDDPNDSVLDNENFCNILKKIHLSEKTYDISPYQYCNFSEELDVKSLFILQNPLKFWIKLLYYGFKRALSFGKKRQKYQQKYDIVKNLIKDAKRYKKSLFKV